MYCSPEACLCRWIPQGFGFFRQRTGTTHTGEQNNLAKQQGAVVEHLSKMMEEFDQELKANPRPAGAEGGRDVFEMPRMKEKK